MQFSKEDVKYELHEVAIMNKGHLLLQNVLHRKVNAHRKEKNGSE